MKKKAQDVSVGVVPEEQAKENMKLWCILTELDRRFVSPFEITDKTTNKTKVLTDVDALHGIAKMTQVFGPCGLNWGYDIGEITMNQAARVAFLKVTLWYDPSILGIPCSQSRAVITEFGAAQITDEKWWPSICVTTGIKRCLRSLGFASGVFSGLQGFDEERNWVDNSGVALGSDGNISPLPKWEDENAAGKHNSKKADARPDSLQTQQGAAEQDISEPAAIDESEEQTVDSKPNSPENSQPAAPASPLTDMGGQVVPDGVRQPLLALLNKMPLLKQCDFHVDVQRNGLYFITSEDCPDAEWYVKQGKFVPSKKHPGKLVRTIPLDWLLKEFVTDDLQAA